MTFLAQEDRDFNKEKGGWFDGENMFFSWSNLVKCTLQKKKKKKKINKNLTRASENSRKWNQEKRRCKVTGSELVNILLVI